MRLVRLWSVCASVFSRAYCRGATQSSHEFAEELCFDTALSGKAAVVILQLEGQNWGHKTLATSSRRVYIASPTPSATTIAIIVQHCYRGVLGYYYYYYYYGGT